MFTATMCEPKISISYHHSVVEQLVRQRDEATLECKETIKELGLMTQELKDLSQTMKEQSDTIESFLETITSQKDTIDELEARVASLEKPDPDLSIYELSDSESECSDVPNEFDTINDCIAGLLVLAVIFVLLTCVKPIHPLSHDDLY